MAIKIRDGGAWIDIASSNASSNVVVNQDNYSCQNPITVDGSTIGIGTTSNAYGTRYVEDHLPLPSDGCDGDLWYYTAGDVSSNIVLATPQTATGTEVAFTGIPSWAKRITIMLNGVEISGNNDYMIQLGTSSGYINSGYSATSQIETGDTEVSASTAFIILSSSSYISYGRYQLDKFSDSAYVFVGQSRASDIGGIHAYGGLTGISGTIDRLKINLSGANTFTGGSFNISYE